jgi:16S rRNA (adenine1518-N6/adenine1519-N6)-dimethyltransferase
VSHPRHTRPRLAAPPGRIPDRPGIDLGLPPQGRAGVRADLARLGRRPRKNLGQHFLVDASIARRIVDLAALDGTQRVIEVGPGLGALTQFAAARARDIWLVERDSVLAARLRDAYATAAGVHVVEGDVLQVDFEQLLGPGSPAVVIGNLPYNIGTAVLAALLARRQCFSRMVLMLQREVVQRLRAGPGSRTYGALSVHTQFAATVRSGFRVRPGAFLPPPKVESEVVIVEPRRQPSIHVADSASFHRLVTAVFSQRRKQLINSLRTLCHEPLRVLDAAGLDPKRRPETLTLEEFGALTNAWIGDAGVA